MTKELVAKAVAKRAADGDIIGLGSGSTSELVVKALAERVRLEGLSLFGVPTSFRISQVAAEAGLHVLQPGSVSCLAWGFDGADEVDERLRLIKGRGGAMLTEKIVAALCTEYLIAVTEDKLVKHLGSRFAVPVEVIPSAVHIVSAGLSKLGAATTELRPSSAKYGPEVTEQGNHIIDASFSDIRDTLEAEIKCLTGVVESGLFFGFATAVIYSKADRTVWRRHISQGTYIDERISE